jgi:hypothetical protein
MYLDKQEIGRKSCCSVGSGLWLAISPSPNSVHLQFSHNSLVPEPTHHCRRCPCCKSHPTQPSHVTMADKKNKKPSTMEELRAAIDKIVAVMDTLPALHIDLQMINNEQQYPMLVQAPAIADVGSPAASELPAIDAAPMVSPPALVVESPMLLQPKEDLPALVAAVSAPTV